MSLRATLWALDDVRTGDPITKLVLLALADEADDDGGSCYPSLRRIAYRAECSVATARRHVAKLESAELIVVDRPAQQGRGHHNRYQLSLPERVPERDPSAPAKVSKGSRLSVTNPTTRGTTTSGCVDCGGGVTTDPATGQPNVRCKACYATSKPQRRPAAQRPVGAPYERWQPDYPDDVIAPDAALDKLSQARRQVGDET